MHKITKLKAVENPLVETAITHDQYRDSIVSGLFKINDEHLSPNVDYWIVGELLTKPTVGERLQVDRWMRNGQLIRGLFTTTTITKITDDGFETQNSVYKLEEVDDEKILEVKNG